MKETTKYWLEVAEYDMETAKGLLNIGRYLYVAFMCHQALEKILKGILTTVHDNPPPYTHNLVRLTELAKVDKTMSEEQILFVDHLNPYNIQARYPNHKLKLYKQTSKEVAQGILEKTEELFQWLKQKIK